METNTLTKPAAEAALAAHKPRSLEGAGRDNGPERASPEREAPRAVTGAAPSGASRSVNKVLALEAELLKLPQVEFRIEHHFAPGIYLREMFLPKGALITGKIHKTEHLCILSRGEVSVHSDAETKRLKASSVVHSLPGTKRAIYAHEDSVWVNVHHNPTDERDLDKIDEVFVVDTFKQFALFMEQAKRLEGKS